MLNQIDLSRTDLNLLTLFELLYQERHVGRAALRLKLSASAVSHGLGRLRRLLNDPLFIRTPKGVVPTDRALELAAPIAEILAQARSVLATAEPFAPARSTRRFTIGAPDGVSALFLPTLLQRLRLDAPGIDLSLRQLLPVPEESAPDRAWRNAFDELEARAIDVAVIPASTIPARFQTQVLYEEDFVIAMRAGHPFSKTPTLARYCEMRHLVVSVSGDARGFVDLALERHALSRRVALTVPNFMFALPMLADTDMICALPRRFAALHAPRFDIVSVEPPLPLPRFQLSAVTARSAMRDAGLAWLFHLLAVPERPARRAGRPLATKQRRR